jgi:hypothetical protein
MALASNGAADICLPGDPIWLVRAGGGVRDGFFISQDASLVFTRRGGFANNEMKAALSRIAAYAHRTPIEPFIEFITSGLLAIHISKPELAAVDWSGHEVLT